MSNTRDAPINRQVIGNRPYWPLCRLIGNRPFGRLIGRLIQGHHYRLSLGGEGLEYPDWGTQQANRDVLQEKILEICLHFGAL